jgi:hypothetical protein
MSQINDDIEEIVAVPEASNEPSKSINLIILNRILFIKY